jgi:uncharacterized membrane protein
VEEKETTLNAETLKALASTAVVFAGSIASALGFDMATDAITQGVCAAVFLVVVGYGVYKNHNFTEAAQEGQKLTDEIKAAAKENEED